MVLGMSHSELGLVIFIFGLVYVALLVPKAGAFVGRKLAGKAGQPRGSSGSSSSR
jgi:hypothetical protein